MRLLHLSDLHLGKRVNEFSMIEDQRHILSQILEIVDDVQPDAVLVAGDVYDKPTPSAEAVALLDEFLVSLSQRQLQVFVISGNHDSPERMAFGGRLMEASGVHMAPVYNGTVTPYTLTDDQGPVQIYLLPFFKPVQARRAFPDREIDTYTQAMAAAIEAMDVNPAVRNVLVTHQFVTGAVRCDSEELSVGGTDNVDASVFDPFDYVALGHIHGPQRVGRDTVRYCGTPLKYSFSEASHHKSVTVVELGPKGDITIDTVPLHPLRDLVELRGTYQEVTHRAFYEAGGYRDCYVHMTLTDEEDIPDAVGKLRLIYPWLMKMDYDNQRTRAGALADQGEETRRQSPMELLETFFQQQNGRAMGQEQRDFAQSLLETIWEDAR